MLDRDRPAPDPILEAAVRELGEETGVTVSAVGEAVATFVDPTIRAVTVFCEAHVDEEWVSRFAAPILAEQEQVIERAQSLAYTAPRKGQSSLPLGLAVQLVIDH